MKALVVRRSPGACWLLAITAFVVHVFLCYPAAVCRGYPPIHPFWECVAPYLAYLAIMLLPMFEDHAEKLRPTKLAFLSAGVLINGIVATNLTSGRPSIGHLIGVSGIIKDDLSSVVSFALGRAVFVFPLGLGMSTLAEQFWSRFRGFAEEGQSGSWLRFTSAGLLGGVAIIAVILSVCTWGVRVYRTLPNATWSHACRNHLRQIGLAMQNYVGVYGRLPPAYIADEEGRPLHSWRVLLLPFLGQKELYKAYRFDEPWDGPHNRALAEKIPEVYRCRWDDSVPPSCTSYLVVVGDETAFPGERAMKPAAIGDGTGGTILVVEAPASGIIWTEPRDLQFNQFRLDGEAVPKQFHKLHGIDGWAQVLFADRYVHAIDSSKTDVFKALLTANGGEAIPEDY